MTEMLPAIRELSMGFHLTSLNPAPFLRPEALNASDPWALYAAVLLRAQQGDFSQVARLVPHLQRSDQNLFLLAATGLVALTSSFEHLQRGLAEFGARKDEPSVQNACAVALGLSCDLRAVDGLLQLYENRADDDLRYEIERSLSYLLEKENSDIWFGAEEKSVEIEDAEGEIVDFEIQVDSAPYLEMVRKVRAKVSQSGDHVKFFAGVPFDLTGFAQSLLKRISAPRPPKDRIFREKLLFEAMTGVSCLDFFDESHAFVQLAAAATLEDFLDSDAPARFAPGQRYFFGHPIPE